jgi:hypothetical protein
MEKKTTWNDLAKVTLAGDVKEVDFSDSIGKAGFSPGPHSDINIVAVEPNSFQGKDGSTYITINLTLQNDAGQKIFSKIFVVDRETGGMSKMLRSLLSSLTKNKELLVKYGSMVKSDLSNLSAIVGMKTSFVVGEPKDGAELVMADGVVTLRDIQTKEEHGTYSSYTEAKAAAKENGFRIGYNEVRVYKAGSENAEALTKIVNAAAAPKPTAIRRQAL